MKLKIGLMGKQTNMLRFDVTVTRSDYDKDDFCVDRKEFNAASLDKAVEQLSALLKSVGYEFTTLLVINNSPEDARIIPRSPTTGAR